MKVLFLDLDGPVYPDRVTMLLPENQGPHKYPEGLVLHDYCSYWKMDEVAVAMLNNLMDIHPFKTVISSSWSQYHNRDQIEKLFECNGLNLDIHEQWTTPKKMSSERIHEIAWWIRDNKPEDYIILDDHQSGSSLGDRTVLSHFLINPERVIMVDVMFGISLNQYNAMRHIVNTW